jgi:DNA invertase Pin-like site-specific DNA recombinase
MGIELISVDEPHIDRTAAGKLSANLLGSVNQFYSDNLSERVCYRMAEAVKAGRFVWRAPLGYRNVQVSFAARGFLGERLPPNWKFQRIRQSATMKRWRETVRLSVH